MSVTFRGLSPRRITELCAECGLQYIEWGGDVHVPVGDIARAEEVRTLTDNAGLHTACYGSYYRAGSGADIIPALRTAAALGAPLVRIWAGTKYDPSDAYFSSVAADISDAVKKAERYGLKISLECHRGTLTQEYRAAVRLAGECGNLLHFQPNPDITDAENDEYLTAILPYLSIFHVFAWDKGDVRLPLAAKAEQWRRRFVLSGTDVPSLIEFVKDDSQSRLRLDAETLETMAERWTNNSGAIVKGG